MRTIGIVSPGAMGSAVGASLIRGGARVVVTVAGRSARTVRLAEAAGLERLPSLADVVRESDVVLSVVPPGQAESVAAALADARLLADLNAVSPATARRISTEVDGSISGPPPSAAGTTRIYLSGPRAAEIADLPFDGVEVVVVGAVVGAASAVKMSTASVYKGTVALLVQALRAADHYGVLRHVLDDLGDAADDAGHRVARAAAKSERYVHEMQEIGTAQAASGLDPALFEAFAKVYEEIAAAPLAREAPENAGSNLSVVLEQLRTASVQRKLAERLQVRDSNADEP
jgi:3-hydroxyisobutyrate dehydrogenase-like beta-hydroxyacid dehydrogenase